MFKLVISTYGLSKSKILLYSKIVSGLNCTRLNWLYTYVYYGMVVYGDMVGVITLCLLQ